MNEGMKVRFIGASGKQVNWGNNDDPREYLRLGEIYTIDKIDIHSWHTKLTLREFPNLRFNSVHFEQLGSEELDPTEDEATGYDAHNEHQIGLLTTMRIFASGMKIGNEVGRRWPAFDMIANEIESWADRLEIEREKQEAVVEAAKKLNIKIIGVEPERDLDYTAAWGIFRDLHDALANLEDEDA